MLHTKNAERKRLGSDGNDAIFADNAVLLAAAYQFAGEKQQWTLAAIDENELIDVSSARVIRRGNTVAVADHSGVALLADQNFTRGEAFFEREEMACVARYAGHNGENADVFVSYRSKQAPVTFRFGRFGRRSGTRRDEAEQTKQAKTGESRDSEETAEKSGEYGTIHEKPPKAQPRKRSCSAS